MGYILVGLDGSPTARSAFTEALREAIWRSADLVALHVVASPLAPGADFRSRVDLDLLRRAGERFLDAELADLETAFEGGFPVSVRHAVAVGHYGEEILRAAHQTDGGQAELVVLGSRGLGGFRSLLLGSVTTYAAHHLETPLLIIPPESR